MKGIRISLLISYYRIEPNLHKRIIPHFPTSFAHPSPTAVGALHTESTTNIDTEEALSNSLLYERDQINPGENAERKDHASYNSNRSQKKTKTNSLNQSYSSMRQEDINPLLQTQPAKKLASPLQERHTHTRSYDVQAVGQMPFQFQPFM